MAYSVVRLSVNATNRDPMLVLDLGRRQVDHLGSYGIRAKRHQTNRRYVRKGYLRFVFPHRRLARRFIKRLNSLGEPGLRYWLMRNPNRYRS